MFFYIFINFRLNDDLINKIKSNNIQALITHEIKSQRNNLLLFENNSCGLSLNKTKGNCKILTYL